MKLCVLLYKLEIMILVVKLGVLDMYCSDVDLMFYIYRCLIIMM